MEIENIGRKDVIWNYLSTFLQIATGVILLPFILKMLPSETVGLWTIFVTITSLIPLLDFGFNPSFTRNISYIFTGVKELKINGISKVSLDGTIDFGLLKGTISAMKWLYARMALIVLILLLVFGSIYMYYVLISYSGDKIDAYFAWIILSLISTYNIYTLYYDSLLQGKGLVKISKQILIIGQTIYLILAILLILLGYGLIAIVLAQAVSMIIKRWLSYKAFFSKDLKLKLENFESHDKKQIISVIYPNAVKLGLTNIGGFLVNKSAIFMGSMYLSLSTIASYGITIQVIGILAGLGGVYYQSYVPKISKCRAESNFQLLKQLYFKSALIQLIIYLSGGLVFIGYGNWFLEIINSKTSFLSWEMIAVGILISFLEKNHALAAGFLVAKNEVPFFKASLISGVATVILLWLLLDPVKIGLWGLLLAQGIAQAAYQNWKWPKVLINELNQNIL